MRGERAVFLCALALALNPGRAAVIGDAAADFSPTSNPNGPWTYGWSSTFAAPMTLYTASQTESGIQEWRSNIASDGNPALYFNPTASSIIFRGTATVPSHQLVLHPGPNGQDSIIRFTVPSAGSYDISANFGPADSTTTDVHVLLNESSIFDSTVNGAPASPFAGTYALLQGDTVDFVVGFGSNNSFNNDSTTVTASIIATPEPASLATFLAGCGAFMRRSTRRRR